METEHISVDLRRLLQACVVLFEIYPRMLKDMISNNFPSVKLDEIIKKAGKNLKKNFNPSETRIIDNIRTEGFTKMDSSLLYKLIRHFELVEKPSSGWDNKPKAGAIKQGDDVQRLRSLRNSIFHTSEATMTEQEHESFFSVFLQCADRLDRYLKRPQMIFTEEIKKVKSLDDSILQPYNKKFEDTEKMQEEASWGNANHVVKTYYKKTLREEIENNENKNDGPEDYIIEISGIKDHDKVIEKIQQFRDTMINECDCEIKLKSVRKGSVVLLVSISCKAFASILALQEQIQLFINRILGIAEVEKWMKKDIRIMLIPIDFIASTEHCNTFQCEKCQVTLKPDAQFCHACGNDVHVERKTCTDCNSAVIEEHNFCPTCGNQRRQALEKECDMVCKRCKVTLHMQPDVNFCHICKWKIDIKSFCPKCKCVIVEEINFCTCCGLRVRTDEHAVKTMVDHYDEQTMQAQCAIKDTDVLSTTVDHNDEQNFQAQNAIIEPESMTEVKRLLQQINEEGSEIFMKHLNKTLNKWKDQKVSFGLAGYTSTGKSSFINLLTGSTEGNEKRAGTSPYGNTTMSKTEYEYPRQRNVSFVDCPGFGTPKFDPESYFEDMAFGSFDYIFIFFSVISIWDIRFAEKLANEKKKFCFVRSKLDLDIANAKHDNDKDSSPDSIASKLRETALESIEKEQLRKPSVFVISNRANKIGHFRDLLSHIEQVLQKTKYDAFIYEISAYTREVINKKYDFLKKRINQISIGAVVDKGEVAADFDFENVRKDKVKRKSPKIIKWLAEEVMLYIETFELNKKSSLSLIRDEYVRQKLKFAQTLTTDVEKNVTSFIKRKLKLQMQKPGSSSVLYNKYTYSQESDEYPLLIPSQNLLSEVLEGLQQDALIVFEEFSKGY